MTNEEKYDSARDTVQHIEKVQLYLLNVCKNLLGRSRVHDLSKLKEPEKSGYDKLTVRLKNIPYGSEEYRRSLEELKPVLEHHYASNSHHPEHFENGIDGMSLFDIFEMLCDWKAASERVKDGSVWSSIEYNVGRFGISEQLHKILKNTATEMGWEK